MSIHISGGISGTVGAAEQARQALVERGIDPGPHRRGRLAHRLRGHGLMAIAAANAAAGRRGRRGRGRGGPSGSARC